MTTDREPEEHHTDEAHDALSELLAAGDATRICWSEEPWASAYPVLRWLGRAPESEVPSPSSHGLSTRAVGLLAEEVALRFVPDAGAVAWSSSSVSTALNAMSAAVGTVPEALLRALWDRLHSRTLDEVTYQFSRAVGRQLLGEYRSHRGWDLEWMLGDATPAQVAFRYWTIGVKPSLWSEALEEHAQALLGPLGFTD